MPAIKIKAHRAQVGPSLSVLRALPTQALRSVGPFVFLDHFGPMPSVSGGPSAHPHAGIEVITWLLEGKNEHRDSMGNHGKIEAGGAQWMKAGKGALHAEQMSKEPAITHGLQLWARQPLTQQEDPPAYAHFHTNSIPCWQIQGATLSLLIGQYEQHSGPLNLGLAGIALRITLEPKAQIALNLNAAFENALYTLTGQLQAEEQHLQQGDLLSFGVGQQQARLQNASTTPCECVLLGGEPAPQPLVFDGPFVFESIARIKQAKQDFIQGKMGFLDGVPF